MPAAGSVSSGSPSWSRWPEAPGPAKSSLLNAIAGEEVAKAGHIRPTTSQPLAWIPAQPEPGLVRLLDDMGIVDRVGHDADDTLRHHRHAGHRLGGGDPS